MAKVTPPGAKPLRVKNKYRTSSLSLESLGRWPGDPPKGRLPARDQQQNRHAISMSHSCAWLLVKLVKGLESYCNVVPHIGNSRKTYEQVSPKRKQTGIRPSRSWQCFTEWHTTASPNCNRIRVHPMLFHGSILRLRRYSCTGPGSAYPSWALTKPLGQYLISQILRKHPRCPRKPDNA